MTQDEVGSNLCCLITSHTDVLSLSIQRLDPQTPTNLSSPRSPKTLFSSKLCSAFNRKWLNGGGECSCLTRNSLV